MGTVYRELTKYYSPSSPQHSFTPCKRGSLFESDSIMIKKIALLTFLTFHMSSAVAAINDPMEQRIVDHIDSALPQSLLELEQAVNINSGTMNFKGVKQVGQFFRQHLDDIGFETQWVDGAAFDRAGHLSASYGTQGVKILLIGHLDTVFTETDEFQTFKRLDKRYVSGPGITDMKGGDVIIVSALRALKALDLLGNTQIKVIMTGDEEHSGAPLSQSKHALIEAAKWADIALGFEDADGNIKTAVTARRGSVSWSLNVEGKPAHSSQIFKEDIGYGAIFEAARILNAFRVELEKEENLTFNPGMIIGGTKISHKPSESTGTAFGKTNVIPKTVKVAGDIRALSQTQLTRAKKHMQKIVASNLAHSSATLTFNEGYPPLSPSQGNSELLSLYNQVSQDLGFGEVTAVNPRNAGAADISFTAGHVEKALDGLGLMGTGGHTRDEVADMSSFSKNIKKSAVMIYRLSRQ